MKKGVKNIIYIRLLLLVLVSVSVFSIAIFLSQSNNLGLTGNSILLSGITNFFRITGNAVADPDYPNLVAYYHFDSNANDATGHEHGGNINGATLVTGKFGNAYSFNGASSYISIPQSNAFSPYYRYNQTYSGVVIAAWIKLNAPIADGKIAGNENNIAGGYKLGIYNNKLEFEIRGPNNQIYNNRGGGQITLQPGIWYYVVGTAGIESDGTLKYIITYVNGQDDYRHYYQSSYNVGPANNDFIIGKESYSNANYFNGVIDELRVYNAYDMNAGDVTTLYNYVPPCTPNWQCTAWSVCSSGTQTRTCTDSNSCGTTTGRPPLSQSCTSPQCSTNPQCGSPTSQIICNAGGTAVINRTTTPTCSSGSCITPAPTSDSTIQTCSSGQCTNGQCVSPGSAIACVDSDIGPANYTTLGTAVNKTGSIISINNTDVCYNSSALIEQYCNDVTKEVLNQTITCQNNCLNGICLGAACTPANAASVCGITTSKLTCYNNTGLYNITTVPSCTTNSCLNTTSYVLNKTCSAGNGCSQLNLECNTNPQPQSNSCADSDSGTNGFGARALGLYDTGNISVLNSSSGATNLYFDSCFNTTSVLEWFCDTTGDFYNITYGCPASCSSSKCTSNQNYPNETCEDSDNGKNYTSEGAVNYTLDGNEISSTDECEGNYIIEYFCSDDNYVDFVKQSCSTGKICSNGRCVSLSNDQTDNGNAAGTTSECNTGESKCEGSSYIYCENNVWLNPQQINGQCGYQTSTASLEGRLGGTTDTSQSSNGFFYVLLFLIILVIIGIIAAIIYHFITNKNKKQNPKSPPNSFNQPRPPGFPPRFPPPRIPITNQTNRMQHPLNLPSYLQKPAGK